MKSFSERKGLKPNRINIQRESIDQELRNALWNSLYLNYLGQIGDDFRHIYLIVPEPKKVLFYNVWMNHYHESVDTKLDLITLVKRIRNEIFQGKWYEVLDLIEFIPNNYIYFKDAYGFQVGEEEHIEKTNKSFYSTCNNSFDKHLSAYRFVNKQITEVTSSDEILSIEEALNSNNGSTTAQTHLKAALELYSNRENPDYRNSMKESISAVEAYCIQLCNNDKATLNKALAILEKHHKLDSSLKAAFAALYNYTSSADGIRHALISEESELKQEDAKFMLVICSAFINYLVIKSDIFKI